MVRFLFSFIIICFSLQLPAMGHSAYSIGKPVEGSALISENDVILSLSKHEALEVKQQGDDSIKKIMPILFTRTASPLSFEMSPFNTSCNLFIGGEVLLQSNALTTSFLNTIYNSEYIDFETKVKQLNKLRDKNGVELTAAAGLNFSWKCDSSLFTHTIGLYQRSVNELKFSNGLFYAAFFGNGDALGATIDMRSNEAHFVQLRQLQYSLKYDINEAFKVYGGISFLQGLSYQRAVLNNASLTTDSLAESVVVAYDLNYEYNNTSNKFYEMNGQGFALDAGIIYTTDPTRYVFTAGFNDLSYLTWNSNTHLNAARGTKKFEGLEVANLFGITDTTFNNIDEDSLLNYFGVAQKEGRAFGKLPFSLNASYQMRTTADFVLSARAIYIPEFYWYPRVELGFGKFFGNRFCAMLRAGTGGFEKYFAGATVYGSFPFPALKGNKGSIGFMLSTDHLTSLFMPDATTGVSAKAGVTVSF